MQILQNVQMLTLTFNPSDREVKFQPSDKLWNKKIQSIYIMGVPYVGPILFPPKPNPWLDSIELRNIGLYLNLYDHSGKQIFKDFSSDNLFVDANNLSYIQYEINRIVDFEKSSFFYRSDAGIDRIAKIRIFVCYQTQNFQHFTEEINGSFTISFDHVYDDTMLSEFVDYTLREKLIKKITTNFRGGLRLIGKDDRRLDLVSSVFFKKDTHKDFYIDPIEVDYEKSIIIDETPSGGIAFNRIINFYY